MSASDTFEVMPVDIFVGGCGHIVLCQEWTEQGSESYLRVLLNERDAEYICARIMESAKKARGG